MKTKFLVSSLTLIISALVVLVVSTNTSSAQFITATPGQQQYQQGSTFQTSVSGNGWSTRTQYAPVRGGLLTPVGQSSVIPPGGLVREHSLTRSGGGEYFHQSVTRSEYATRYFYQDPMTGRRQAAVVSTMVVTTNSAQYQMPPYYPTPVQTVVAKDAPTYKVVYGPSVAGKRGNK